MGCANALKKQMRRLRFFFLSRAGLNQVKPLMSLAVWTIMTYHFTVSRLTITLKVYPKPKCGGGSQLLSWD